MATDLSPYKSLQIIVDGTEQTKTKTGFEATAVVLKDEFIQLVKDTNKYLDVGSDVTGDNVLVARLTITELNYVHGGELELRWEYSLVEQC